MKVNQYNMAKITAALVFCSFSLSTSASSGNVFNSKVPFYPSRMTMQQKGSIVGQVVDAQGLPLANVHVQLPGVKSTKSDKDGYFKLPGIPYGKYRLTLSAVGFSAVSQEIEIREEQLLLDTMTLAAEQYSLDEVVVTASRLAEHIDEVPSSITYIGGKVLDQQRQSTIICHLS